MFGAEEVDLDDDEPEAWPDVAQQKLDESLRCAICGDLFTMPVSLATCTHTCKLGHNTSSCLPVPPFLHSSSTTCEPSTRTGYRATVLADKTPR